MVLGDKDCFREFATIQSFKSISVGGRDNFSLVGLEQWNAILRYGVCCAPIVPNLDYVAHIQIACVKAISAPVAVILDDVRMFYTIKLFKEDYLILAE
jgi:hypothetical protein